MTFRGNLNRICTSKGTTLTRMCKELGISTSKVTAINTGSIPTEEMMLKFANHLDCSVMDFFADEVNTVINQNHNCDNNGSISNNAGSTDTYTTNNYYSSLGSFSVNKEVPITKNSKEYFFHLIDKLKNMKDEQLVEMINYADFIISKNGDLK